MATNDFIGFASSGNANIMSQADYAAAHEQLVGVQPGMASSAMANKAWRQGANMAAALGDLMSAQGYDALDNGDISKLTKNLSMAVALAIEYKATYDFKSGSICRYNGDLYIALIDNGPSSSVKAPTDVTAWAKIILTTATQSAAGYMSASDKATLDELDNSAVKKTSATQGTITATSNIVANLSDYYHANGTGSLSIVLQISNTETTQSLWTDYSIFTISPAPKIPICGVLVSQADGISITFKVGTDGVVILQQKGIAFAGAWVWGGVTFPVD